MKYIYLLLLIPVMFASQSCTKPKPKEPHITSTIPVPKIVMDYFVNDEVGTCWVYQDSINPAKFDTIELTQIMNDDFVTDSGVKFNGYILFYKPHKTEQFRMWITTGLYNVCDIKITPVISGNGSLHAGERDSNWAGAVYRDSMQIMHKTYYQTLEIHQTADYFADLIYAKNIGLVSYQSAGLFGVKGTGGIYKFVKKFKK